MAAMKPWQVIRRFDWFVILTVLTVALAGIWLSAQGGAGEKVIVEQQGKVVYAAPLDRDTHVVIPGPLGSTEIEIAQGKARVVSASCPHKVCQGMGEIAKQGEVIACVPNKLVIRISGERLDSGYDVLSR